MRRGEEKGGGERDKQGGRKDRMSNAPFLSHKQTTLHKHNTRFALSPQSPPKKMLRLECTGGRTKEVDSDADDRDGESEVERRFIGVERRLSVRFGQGSHYIFS